MPILRTDVQVEPIRRRLLERERRLKGEEEELKALEAIDTRHFGCQRPALPWFSHVFTNILPLYPTSYTFLHTKYMIFLIPCICLSTRSYSLSISRFRLASEGGLRRRRS